MKKLQFIGINHVGIINSLIVVFLFLSNIVFGQVGINTTNPNATLDIRSTNQGTPANTDGILIPKADNFPSANPTVNQDGMLLFATGNGTPNKGFYYWDNANTIWVPLTITGGGGSGNTLDQAYDQGGAGLGKNINATNGALRINGTDGFLVTGDVFYGNPIDTEITGAGTRMFFNPLMSAFRAGTVWDIPPLVGDEWDATNMGLFSAAFGLNTTASGLTSTAFGSITTASGGQSTAFGSATTASGNVSTAFGYNSIASGSHSTTLGYSTAASAETSTAFGSFTSASESYSTAFGSQSSASGVTATAFGSSTIASGDTSTAFGSLTEASGNVSTAFGAQTLASGSSAAAFGSNSVASGTASTAFGFGIIAPSSYETALGMYNTTYVPVAPVGYSLQDRIFVVGNGVGSSARSNALTIYKSGITIIDDVLGIGTNSPTATLSVNGTANKPGGGTWAVFSDERLKENISDYNEGLDLITRIRPVNFSYNSKVKSLLGENQPLDKLVYQGVIAQDLQKIAPDMVREVALDKEHFLEVDPNKFTYALINAVQEQQKQIAKQQNKIEGLEKQLKKQQTEIDAIKALLKMN